MKLLKSGFDKLDELKVTATTPDLYGRKKPRIRPEFPSLYEDGDELGQRRSAWWLTPMVFAGGAIWAVVLF
ncbi:hypothetical protein MASR2M74_02690 [Paracoccaceae bacterium]